MSGAVPASTASAKASSCELADVFRRYGEAYQQTHPLTRPQRKACWAITHCRTAALGGHRQWCPACGFQRYTYHSCRNRHCPKCQTTATAACVATWATRAFSSSSQPTKPPSIASRIISAGRRTRILPRRYVITVSPQKHAADEKLQGPPPSHLADQGEGGEHPCQPKGGDNQGIQETILHGGDGTRRLRRKGRKSPVRGANVGATGIHRWHPFLIPQNRPGFKATGPYTGQAAANSP